MTIELFRHNAEAYEEVLNLFESTGKAAVIHPTGTGKSFIGFKLCEDFPESKVLWLSPSEYIFETQLQNLKEAAADYEPDNVEFCTYARLMRMSEEEIAELNPDYLVLDEFHRAGAEKWGEGIQRLIQEYPNVPRLGLSATAIRYLDNQRDMADELFDGCVASEITLGEAVVRGILTPPRYVTTVYSYQKDYERYHNKVRKLRNKELRENANFYLETLKRRLENADGLDVIFNRHMTERHGKYIVFCADYEHLQEMAEKAGEWFRLVDPFPRIYSVYSDDPSSSKSFAQFKEDNQNDHLRLLYCIDALNEGIHVEGVSGVILLRPTVSPIIYKQQIGRALSAGSRADAVIFDIVMNIDNLYSIDSIKEEMRVALTYYRSLGDQKQIVNERFDVIDEVQNCRELFEKLDDTLTASWDVMYGFAQAYYAEHGNLDIPYAYKAPEGYSLGSWVNIQRRVYQGVQPGILDAGRIQKLNEIGMIWDMTAEIKWKKFYSAAESYYQKYGDLKVPTDYATENGVNLWETLSRIRIRRRTGGRSIYLLPEHIAALDKLGMVWDIQNESFERNLQSAENYYRTHGDLAVPVNYVDENGIRLGMWLSNLRSARRENLPEELKLRLDRLGMRWESYFDVRWEAGYRAAMQYLREYGNLNVPVSYVTADGYKLGQWICNQKNKWRIGKLKPDQEALLTRLGLVWKRESVWNKRFALAKAYYEKNGDLNIPMDYTADGFALGEWLFTQKTLYRHPTKNRTLSTERILQLESIGIVWELQVDVIWKERYQAFKQYYEEHGTPKAPPQLVLADGKPAGAWLQNQKQKYRKGKLTAERAELLSQIDTFKAGPKKKSDKDIEAWRKAYTHAEAYYRENSNLLVPYSYVSPDGFLLGKWVAAQRAAYRRSPKTYFTEWQKELLKKIGMTFNPSDERWENGYEFAAQYYEQHHNLDVPVDCGFSGFNLGRWIHSQRQRFEKKTISEEQIQKLNEIGMLWTAPKKEGKWFKIYKRARDYYDEHGDVLVPQSYVCPDGYSNLEQ